MQSSLPRQLNKSPSNPHGGRLGQRPTSGPTDSETQSSRVSFFFFAPTPQRVCPLPSVCQPLGEDWHGVTPVIDKNLFCRPFCPLKLYAMALKFFSPRRRKFVVMFFLLCISLSICHSLRRRMRRNSAADCTLYSARSSLGYVKGEKAQKWS